MGLAAAPAAPRNVGTNNNKLFFFRIRWRRSSLVIVFIIINSYPNPRTPQPAPKIPLRSQCVFPCSSCSHWPQSPRHALVSREKRDESCTPRFLFFFYAVSAMDTFFIVAPSALLARRLPSLSLSFLSSPIPCRKDEEERSDKTSGRRGKTKSGLDAGESGGPKGPFVIMDFYGSD